jgi:nifR3 family TIM-barrel protein
MAGVTDRQFRLILRRLGGVGLVTMEFISSEALTRGNRRTLQMMHYCEEERPLSIQIYGSSPQRMAEAARIVEGIGADVCDINMGCPSNKVLKGCAGSWLMGDLALAGRIISTVRAAISIPLTVKFRAGVREERLNYVELGRICQDEGVDGVALHPRTAKQMYRGRADWARIARLKDALTIPVVGNGDVSTADDALCMFEETGCDAVMIGRASMKNPWIFRQTVDRLAGRPHYEPTLQDRRRLIRTHFELLTEQEETKLALHKLRTFTGWYTHGLPGGRQLRLRISSLATPEAFLEAVEQFFAQAPVAA